MTSTALVIRKKKRQNDSDKNCSALVLMNERKIKAVLYKPDIRTLNKEWNQLYNNAKVLKIERFDDRTIISVDHTVAVRCLKSGCETQQNSETTEIVPYTGNGTTAAQAARRKIQRKYRTRGRYTTSRRIHRGVAKRRPVIRKRRNVNDVIPEIGFKIELEIPDALKQLSDHDKSSSQNKNQYTCFPARYSVNEIIKQYLESLELEQRGQTSDGKYNYEELDLEYCCAEGIKEYFNVYLWSRLLYLPERVLFIRHLQRTAEVPYTRYIDIYSEPKRLMRMANCEPSSVFGFTHLLRLFSKFSFFLRIADWSTTMLENSVHIKPQLEKFIRFLELNSDKYFDLDKDYIG